MCCTVLQSHQPYSHQYLNPPTGQNIHLLSDSISAGMHTMSSIGRSPVHKNQVPISIEATSAGAAWVTKLSPTGLAYSSPTVSQSMDSTSHHTLQVSPSDESVAAKTIRRYAVALITQPMAILATDDGSCPLVACHPQNLLTSGISVRMNSGLSD